MVKQLGNKSAWLIALWSIVPVAIALVSIVFIVVAIVGFEWGVIVTLFKGWWPAFLVIIAFVYVLMLLITKYPIGTVSTGLLIIAFVFAIASPKENYIAEHIREYINNNFDVNYVIGSMTILALALAFTMIRRAQIEN